MESFSSAQVNIIVSALVIIFIAGFIGIWLMEHTFRNQEIADLRQRYEQSQPKWYPRVNYNEKSGESFGPLIVSLDNGKNWGAVKVANGEIRFVGPAEKVSPDLLTEVRKFERFKKKSDEIKKSRKEDHRL